MKYTKTRGIMRLSVMIIALLCLHANVFAASDLYVIGGNGAGGGGSAPWCHGGGVYGNPHNVEGYSGQAGDGGNADATQGGGGGGGSGAYVGTQKNTIADNGNGEDGGLFDIVGTGGKGINSVGTGAQSGKAGHPAVGRIGGDGGDGGNVDTIQSGSVYNKIAVHGGRSGGEGGTGDYFGGSSGLGGSAKLTLSEADRIQAKSITLYDGDNWSMDASPDGQCEVIVKAKQIDLDTLNVSVKNGRDGIMSSLKIDGVLTVKRSASFYNEIGKRAMAVDINTLLVTGTVKINLETTQPGDVRIDKIVIEDGSSLTIESKAGVMSVGSIEIIGDGLLIMKGGRDATEVIELDGKWSPKVSGTSETREAASRDALNVWGTLSNNAFEGAAVEKSLTAVILSGTEEVTRAQTDGIQDNGRIKFAFVSDEQIDAIVGLPSGAYDVVVFAAEDARNFAIENTVITQVNIVEGIAPKWSIPGQITVTKGITYDFVRIDPDVPMPAFTVKNTKKNVAALNADFQITGKKKGKTAITLTDESGKKQSCTVTVVNNVLSYNKPLRLDAPGIYTSTKKISYDTKRKRINYEFFLLNCSGKPVLGLDHIRIYIANDRQAPEHHTSEWYNKKFKKPLKNNAYRIIRVSAEVASVYERDIANLDLPTGRYQIAFGGTDRDGNTITPLYPHVKGVTRDKKAVKSAGVEDIKTDEAPIEEEAAVDVEEVVDAVECMELGAETNE